MRRDTFDDAAPLPPHGRASGPANPHCCRVCGDPTPTKTLSDFGAMCFACYADYCRATAAPSVDRAKAIAALRALNLGQGDPKAWAKRLQSQEANGVHLSAIQRAAWREALHLPPPASTEAFA